MNGIHDLGGMHGFGAIEVEPGERGFHAHWEGRVVGVFVAMLAQGWLNMDAFRHGIERLPPAVYLGASYFERWRRSIEGNLAHAGVLVDGELEGRVAALREGTAAAPAAAPPEPLAPSAPGFVRSVEAAPRFAAGDAVRARNLHPEGHTRLPRYVRGRCGRVDRVHPAFVFPDTNAHGRGECPQHLYTVVFAGAELWGDDAEPGSSVRIDLFESYLLPAAEPPGLPAVEPAGGEAG